MVTFLRTSNQTVKSSSLRKQRDEEREKDLSPSGGSPRERPVGREASLRTALGPQRAAQITMKTAAWDTCRGLESPKEVDRVPTYVNNLIPSCCLLSDTSQCAKRQQMFHKPCSQTVFSLARHSVIFPFLSLVSIFEMFPLLDRSPHAVKSTERT